MVNKAILAETSEWDNKLEMQAKNKKIGLDFTKIEAFMFPGEQRIRREK